MIYRVAVAVSGRGSNLEALHHGLAVEPSVQLSVVISDRAADALVRARSLEIPAVQLADYRDADEWRRHLDQHGVDLLVLAGYLRLVPPGVIARMRGRIINVHPALLPRHGGRGMHGQHVHRAVLAASDVESGATVHLVDEEYDQGTILAQGRVRVPAGATAESLAALVLAVEHRLLPAAVRAAARAGHPVPFEFA